MAKIGRNDPCPCGSGKKYKLCHYGDAAFEPSSDAELGEAPDLSPSLIAAGQRRLERATGDIQRLAAGREFATDAELDAFLAGVKDGDFDDLLG